MMKRSLVPGMRSVFGSTMREKTRNDRGFDDAMKHDVEKLFEYVLALEEVATHARPYSDDASPLTRDVDALHRAISIVDEFHERVARGDL